MCEGEKKPRRGLGQPGKSSTRKSLNVSKRAEQLQKKVERAFDDEEFSNEPKEQKNKKQGKRVRRKGPDNRKKALRTVRNATRKTRKTPRKDKYPCTCQNKGLKTVVQAQPRAKRPRNPYDPDPERTRKNGTRENEPNPSTERRPLRRMS